MHGVGDARLLLQRGQPLDRLRRERVGDEQRQIAAQLDRVEALGVQLSDQAGMIEADGVRQQILGAAAAWNQRADLHCHDAETHGGTSWYRVGVWVSG